jgi:serine/threonine-protein kinase
MAGESLGGIRGKEPAMTPERYQRLCELFDRAQAQPPERRTSFLREVVAADPTLAAELQSMLADDRQAQGEQLLRQPCPVNARALLPDDRPTRLDAPRDGPDPDETPPAVEGYRLDGGRLGAGGMGVVWLGRDARLHRAVAVKVLRHGLHGRPYLERRFVEEAQVASQLAHPAIPPVHALGTLADGRPFFVMKLVRGRTLADLLDARAGPADDLPRLVGTFEQVCQGVAYAHSKGVIHRDLKPSNVMVGAFGEVQVMDWGLAKILQIADCRLQIEESGAEAGRASCSDNLQSAICNPQSAGTETGQVLGTPAYMAPEQARGEVGALDERCDVFSLGAILCHVLTGQPPFAGSAEGALARARAGAVTDALMWLAASGADAELLAVAKGCLAPEPADRPRDAGAVAAAVAAYLESVRERLRRAELERAAAEARAQEEARTRAVAEAKAAVERRARRLAVGLAAAVLGLVAVGAGAALYVEYQAAGRREEQARHEAQQRQAGESALDRAAALRQQARWREAQAVLEQARRALDGAGPDDVRQRLDGALAEVTLVNRLDAIRLRRATPVEGSFDDVTAVREYAAEFREAGLGEVGDDEAAAAARVRASGVAPQLVAALDDWAQAAAGDPEMDWLLAVARRADPDPSWRDRFRDKATWWNVGALRDLADEALRDDGAKLGAISPHLLVSLGQLLDREPQAVRLLRAAQRRYPNDFWLNVQLGIALRKAKQPEEAVGYYRAAVALRPDASAVHNNLGNALRDKGDADGAIAAYHTALDLDSQFAVAHFNLGNALRDKGDAIGAVAALEKAIELAPKLVPAYYNLGLARRDRGDLQGAVVAYRKAIDLDGNFANSHGSLGQALLEQGHFAEAREATARCLKLLPPEDSWRSFLSRQLRQCERLAAADEKLPAVLRGEADPAGAAECVALGQLCGQFKHLNAAAARFYAAAFAADPRLAADLPEQHRYNAACCAALAAAGQGEDTKNRPDKVAVMFRRQALGWLWADLTLYAQRAEGDGPARQFVRQSLAHWQRDDDLISVRDRRALDQLPEDERRDWTRLWEEVGRLLRQVDVRP